MSRVPSERDPLHTKAEAEHIGAPQTKEPARPADELLHDLRVHQIELEMQNDELQRSQVVIEESRDHYLDLYEFAPVGYLTLTHEGMIAKVNLTGAALLGVERKKLIGHRFASFITPEDNERWHQHFLNVLQHDGQQRCELVLRRNDASFFHAQLDCLHMQSGGASSVRISLADITERKHAEIELRASRQLLRQLAAQDVTAREAEHKHIAREVHDELGQILTALRMDVSLLRIEFGERDPVLLTKIQDMLLLVDKAIQGVRDVATNLRPPALDMGIIPAITWLCDEFSNHTTTACTLQIIDDQVELDDALTVAVFRIVQESLTNVARYAAANCVEIKVWLCGGDIAVEVRDDGKGFDPDATQATKSFGLLGMRERALALGGRVEIISAPSKGTVVSVRIPVAQPNPRRRADDPSVDSR